MASKIKWKGFDILLELIWPDPILIDLNLDFFSLARKYPAYSLSIPLRNRSICIRYESEWLARVKNAI